MDRRRGLSGDLRRALALCERARDEASLAGLAALLEGDVVGPRDAALATEVPEVAAAEDLRQVVAKELATREVLKDAAEARDRDALTGALAAAAKLGPGVLDSPEHAVAARVAARVDARAPRPSVPPFSPRRSVDAAPAVVRSS